jgi:hypothetical protein
MGGILAVHRRTQSLSRFDRHGIRAYGRRHPRRPAMRPLLARLLLAALLAPRLAAGEVADNPATTWGVLRDIHLDALVAFAKAGERKGGSLDLEVRQEAANVARRIDPKSDKLKNLFATKKAMSADEQAADKLARATVAEREKARTAGDPKLPEPATVKEELELLRHKLVNDEVAFAEKLSLDPDDQETVKLRQAALKAAQELLGPPRWGWEKAMKERIAKAMGAAYAPWNGTWTGGPWMSFTLVQQGAKVTSTWTGGSLVGEVKGRNLVGAWKHGTQKGTFHFSLASDDNGFDARCTVEQTNPENWTAMRAGTEPPPVVVEEPVPAEPPAGAKPESAGGEKPAQ